MPPLQHHPSPQRVDELAGAAWAFREGLAKPQAHTSPSSFTIHLEMVKMVSCMLRIFFPQSKMSLFPSKARAVVSPPGQGTKVIISWPFLHK